MPFKRYVGEVERLSGVLDAQLSTHQFIAGGYAAGIDAIKSSGNCFDEHRGLPDAASRSLIELERLGVTRRFAPESV